MKYISLAILALCLNLSGIAQTLDLSTPLPVDKSIKKGVLPNGMTYYLHSTDVTEDVASYYIIQNVGSVLEKEDQRGLAHFLEHMAFNGTKTFPGKALLNQLEENGLKFGRDINAYTSFNETVYNINSVPTTPELMELGLQALHDWSNYLLLEEEEIDAERGVVKEEWRTRGGGPMRILEQTIGTLFGHSLYVERLPIGLMSVVDNFEYQTLRDFYHDWYRTDLQAIAVIGDFDVAEMEAKIKAKFSSIPAVKNPPERFTVKIKANKKLDFVLAMDDEVSSTSISFAIRHDRSLEDQTVEDLSEYIVDRAITGSLNNRFNEIAQQADAPILGVSAYYAPEARIYSKFGFKVYPKLNRQQEAFELAMKELNRAVKFGFTKAEIKRVIVSQSSFYENYIEGLDNRGHGSIIGTIKQNYLENAHMTDAVKEYELAKEILASLTAEQLLNRLKTMYAKKNRSVIVTGVEGRDNLSEEQVKEIIRKVENSPTLMPYEEEEVAEKSLMTGVNLTPGSIVSESKNEALGYTTFALSNGIEVHYKFVDKTKNSVSLQAVSDGGTSLLDIADLPSAGVVSSVASKSGLGAFSSIELGKLLTGKTAQSAFSVTGIEESVSGYSSTKDVETMLQLVNLRFTKPRFDQNAYDLVMQNMDNSLVSRSKSLSAKMSDSVTVTVYGEHHPTQRLFNQEYIDDISFDQVKRVYMERFDNAGDFTFFIVGDVKADTLKPLLEQYIASLPTTDKKETWKDKTSDWISKNIDKDIYLAMEESKTSVRIGIQKEMPYTLRDKYLVRVLGSILQLRYTESLREEEGGTYGASTGAYLTKEPRSEAMFAVSFDCNPDMAEKLITIVYSEIEKLKEGTVSQEDLDKVLSAILKSREDGKSQSYSDNIAIKTHVLEGYNRQLPENFEDIINSITVRDIQELVANMLKDNKSYEIVFKPQLN